MYEHARKCYRNLLHYPQELETPNNGNPRDSENSDRESTIEYREFIDPCRMIDYSISLFSFANKTVEKMEEKIK